MSAALLHPPSDGAANASRESSGSRDSGLSPLAQHFVPACGAVLAFALFVSPLPDVMAARARGELGVLNPLPWMVMLIYCATWTSYGAALRDTYILVAAGFGIACSGFCTVTAVRLSTRLQFRELERAGYPLAFMLVVVFVVSSLVGPNARKLVLGTMLVAMQLLLALAPLSTLREMVRIRSGASIHLQLCVASTASSVLWGCYGLGLDDPFLFAPCAIGATSGFTQLLLKSIYHRRGPPQPQGSARAAGDDGDGGEAGGRHASTGGDAPARAPACPICLDPMPRPIELSCTHALCAACALKCSGAGLSSCPVCRHPHLLDPKLLQERRAAWRSAYGGWRKGRAKGAAGEFSSITSAGDGEPSARSERRRESALVRALDLAHVERGKLATGAAGSGCGC